MTLDTGPAPLHSVSRVVTDTSSTTGPVVDEVWEALRTVRDPELDTDVVSLDFVASATVDPDRIAHVRLRLPTYFCAPNFAFLMVADAWDAVSQVPGLGDVDVQLLDHFASDAINAGVAARAGFVGSMAGTGVGEAVEELDDLRRKFTERAVMAGTDQVVRPLMANGHTVEQIAGMTLGDAARLAGSSEALSGIVADLGRLRDRRRELGLPVDDDAPLVLDPAGGRVGVEALPLHLRKARSYQVGVDANTSICRGQLAVRYGI
jgi:metal-sulfur cluster biosynthetic enzyme